jgi:tetratricopeptide (TPR) repeat protein
MILSCLVSWTSTATAQDTPDSKLCGGDDLGASIAACSRSIDSGVLTTHEMVLACSNRGVTYARQGEFGMALANLENAIAIEPDYARAYSNRGHVYALMGYLENALKDQSKAITLDPQDANFYINRGTVYRRTEQLDLAILDQTKAIELAPNSKSVLSFAYNNRGLAYTDQQDYSRALADFTHAFEIDPKNVDPLNSRGVVHQRMGNQVLAVTDFKHVIEIDPKYLAAHRNLIGNLQRNGDYEGAIKAVQQIANYDPKNQIDYSSQIGYLNYYAGHFEVTAAVLARVNGQKLEPHNAIIQYFAQLRSGSAAIISKDLYKALALTPAGQWPSPLVSLALDKANSESVIAAANTPDDLCEAHYFIGQWHLVHKRKAEAAAASNAALQNCVPDSALYVAAQIELRRLAE